MKKHYLKSAFLTSVLTISSVVQIPTHVKAESMQITNVKKEKNKITFVFTDNQKMQINFLSDEIFHLQKILENGAFLDKIPTPSGKENAHILVKNDAEYAGSEYQLQEEGNTITIQTKKLQLVVDKLTGKMTLKKANGEIVFSEKEPITLTNNSSAQTLVTDPNEYFFGGGTQNGRFSHKNSRIEIVNSNNWVDGGVASPNPFYWSTKGYGMLRNTYNPGFYDFGKTTTNTVINQHTDPRFDSYFFVGNSPKELLEDYITLTGKPAQLPDYAYYLGHLNCYNRDYWVETTNINAKKIDGKYYTEHNPNSGGVPQGGIKESLLTNTSKDNAPFTAQRQIELHQEHDMPLGWFLPNDGYGCGFGQDASNLDANIQNLHNFQVFAQKYGVETGLWTQSDLTPKGNNAILQRDFEKEVNVAGVNALKTDVAWVGSGYTFGLNGLEEATKILDKTNKKYNVVTLDGWAGTQRYGGIWSGDQTGGQWEYIRFHIPTFIGTGLSGQPHIGSDMDGIFGGNNPNVQVRDFQFKSFAGYMLDMDGWGSSQKNPWEFGGKYEDINRAYLKLKAQLLPYTATESNYAHETGMPILKAMMLEYPNAYTYSNATQYQYLWGSNFLVAPIYQNTNMNEHGNDIRNNIYLPNNPDGSELIWIDYISGKQYRGGNILNNYDAPLWKLPVFVKNGAIIPMYQENNNPQPITETNPKGLDRSHRIVEFYPNGNTNYTVYEDDGATKNGGNLKTEITSQVNNDIATLTLNKAIVSGNTNTLSLSKDTKFIVNVSQKPTSLTMTLNDNDVALTEVTTKAEFDKASNNVYFYDEHPTTFIQDYAHTNEIKTLQTNTSPKLYIKTAEKVNVVENKLSLRINGFKNNSLTTKNELNTKLAAPTNFQMNNEATTFNQIALTWNAVDSATSYDVLANDNQLYTNIKQNAFINHDLHFATTYNYKVRAVNAEGYSNWSDVLTATTKDDPYRNVPEGYRILSNVEEQGGQELSKLFDHDLATLWHTNWGKPNAFNTLEIDLNGSYELDHFDYLPRDDAGNGTILSGTVSISKDNVHYKEIGNINWEQNANLKSFTFPEKTGRFSYIRISNIKSVGGFGSGREFTPYTKDPKRKFKTLDYNDDKEINEGEITFLQNYAGLSQTGKDSDWDYVEIADVNYNNVIDATDISAITRMLNGGLNYVIGEEPTGKFKLLANKNHVEAGEQVTYQVYGIGLSKVNAISFAMPINTSKFENVVITPDLSTMQMRNFSTVRTHSNNQTTAYVLLANQGEQTQITGNGVIATITMTAKVATNTDVTPDFALVTNKSLVDRDALLTDETLSEEIVDTIKLAPSTIQSVEVKNDHTNGWINPETLMQNNNYTNLYDGDTATESEFKWYINPDSFTEEVSLPINFKFTLNNPQKITKFVVYNRNNLNGNGTITSLKASYISEDDTVHEIKTFTEKQANYEFNIPENTIVKAIIVTPLTSTGKATGITKGSEDNRMLTFSEISLFTSPVKATDIAFNNLKTTMFVNELQLPAITVSPENAIEQLYQVTSSDENVLKVERYVEQNTYHYLLQARHAGTTKITLSLVSNPNIKKEVTITVEAGINKTYLNTLLQYANTQLTEQQLYQKEYITNLHTALISITAKNYTEQAQVDADALSLYTLLNSATYIGSNDTLKTSLSEIKGEFTAAATSFAQGENDNAANAIDNDPTTIWHSDYQATTTLPQSITVDLKKTHNLNQVSYLPRQNNANGHITQYRIEISNDNEVFTPVVAGNFSNNGKTLDNENSPKVIKFTPVNARYVRFIAERTLGNQGTDNDHYASIAELKFFEYEAVINQTVAGVTIQIEAGNAPANTTVNVEHLGTKVIDDKEVISYEINLTKSNKKVQLYEDATALVTIPVDANRIVENVYYVENGKLTEAQELVNYSPNSTSITFVAKHFSEYAIVYKKQTQVQKQEQTQIEDNQQEQVQKPNQAQVQIKKQEQNIVPNKKQKTKITTNDNNDVIFFTIVSIITLFGIIIIARKRK